GDVGPGLEQRRQAHAGLRLHGLQNLGGRVRCDVMRKEVILSKDQIPNVGGMEASGGADMVGEPQPCRGLPAWRAAPATRGVVLIAPRVRDGQGAEPLFRLPFFKTDASLAEDQKVRRV